jgi:hypothetical protein
VGLFANGVYKVMGNGNGTRFWSDVWAGGQLLATRFPRLFSISLQQQSSVSQMRLMKDVGWRWVWNWRRELFEWEEVLLNQLMVIIAGFQPMQREDRWQWRADPEVGLTAKVAYQHLQLLTRQGGNTSQQQQFIFSNLWKGAAPSKVLAFSWQLMLDRIPTKDNLRVRGVPCDNGMMCPLCSNYEETACHLFLCCEIAARIWYEILAWVGQFAPLPPNLNLSFAMFVGFWAEKKGGKE